MHTDCTQSLGWDMALSQSTDPPGEPGDQLLNSAIQTFTSINTIQLFPYKISS
jgi:hypothetical protein